MSTPKSGMDGRGVSQGGFLGRGVDTKNVEDDTEASFDDSNIREVGPLASLLSHPKPRRPATHRLLPK